MPCLTSSNPPPQPYCHGIWGSESKCTGASSLFEILAVCLFSPQHQAHGGWVGELKWKHIVSEHQRDSDCPVPHLPSEFLRAPENWKGPWVPWGPERVKNWKCSQACHLVAMARSRMKCEGKYCVDSLPPRYQGHLIKIWIDPKSQGGGNT